MQVTEMFPEEGINTYADVQRDHVVDDPLSGVLETGVADQTSDKDRNFNALREEVAKMKSEREYWRGQAEAYSRTPSRQQPEVTPDQAIHALDWEDGNDVRKAWETLRQENVRLREEVNDSLAAIKASTQHQDWNNLVSQHVPELTSKNPIFAEMIQKASNPYEAAYLLAELNARASQTATPPQYGNGQRAISNASKPQSLASVGGRGQLSTTDYYASMSDKDFMELAARNLANI